MYIKTGFYAVHGHNHDSHGLVSESNEWVGMCVIGRYGQLVKLYGSEAGRAYAQAMSRPVLEMAVTTGAIAAPVGFATKENEKKVKKPKKQDDSDETQVILGDTDEAEKKESAGEGFESFLNNTLQSLAEESLSRHFCSMCRGERPFVESVDRLRCTVCAHTLWKVGSENISFRDRDKYPGFIFHIPSEDLAPVSEVLDAQTLGTVVRAATEKTGVGPKAKARQIKLSQEVDKKNNDEQLSNKIADKVEDELKDEFDELGDED